MGIFRRRAGRAGAERAPDDAYQEAQRNPELLAAEREVNEEPYVEPLFNPLIDPPNEPY